MMGFDDSQINPEPSFAISFAMTELAAITDGSSIAIGTKKVLLLTLTLSQRPKGIETTPIQFSII